MKPQDRHFSGPYLVSGAPHCPLCASAAWRRLEPEPTPGGEEQPWSWGKPCPWPTLPPGSCRGRPLHLLGVNRTEVSRPPKVEEVAAGSALGVESRAHRAVASVYHELRQSVAASTAESSATAGTIQSFTSQSEDPA